MTDNSKASGFLSRGGAWVVVQSILMTAVIVLGVIFHGDWRRLPMIAVGAVLFVVGGYIGIAGLGVLGRSRTPYPKPREGSELVERGIYAQVRHPLYTSVVLASLGWSLIWQSWPAFAAVLALIPFFHAKARCEESWLREKFSGYADYERRIPRFIPRLRRPSKPV